MKRKFGLFLCVLLAGCAAYRPIVDPMQISDLGKYERDLQDCQRVAEQGLDPVEGAVGGAVLGGLIGAAFGAALGAFTGDASLGAGYGAAIGGGSGLVGGTAAGLEERKKITANCMTGRGYNPLD